ncbi:receptor-like protein kinase FERONIA [Cannabis sativa]|uniref:receptor-like protein kinase FERONIA n=1 Tax=Cannabis sativa TaxID=3483 RepID=UPI0029CA7F7C|nr:receptor-like protein kinase FERONIA [Cannabis sativa]
MQDAIANYISVFLLFTLSTAINQTPNTPTDYLFLDCGSSSSSSSSSNNHQTDTQGRLWASDSDSKHYYYSSSPPNIEDVSSKSIAKEQDSSVPQVPYKTARIFLSKFTYSFLLTPGPKFLRLYFYSATYSNNLNKSDSFFSVTANNFVLLNNFSVYLTAYSAIKNPQAQPYFSKEFIINNNQKLINITFNPSPNSYAFINGIEIVSIPENLYISNDDDKPKIFVNNPSNPFFSVTNNTVLENVYRLNVGGPDVLSINDTVSMFRNWKQDLSYIHSYNVGTVPYLPNVKIHYSEDTPAYTAPEIVYTTFRQMDPISYNNTKYNLTWYFPLDSAFYYLVRLHFCSILNEITRENQIVFNIYMNRMIAHTQMDVIHFTGGSKIPKYIDYIIYIEKDSDSLLLELQPSFEINPENYNAMLNGAEIFKLNRSDGSLAGPNPAGPAQNHKPMLSPILRNSEKKVLLDFKAITVSGIVLGLLFCLLSVKFFFIIRRRRTSLKASSGITKASSLPSDLCRHFTIKEIREATGNFDERRVIGFGGFGNVYKGDIDGVIVAVKRLNPSSKQGAKEFFTEIDMLSKLRHVHLVSLLGYCDDNGEMVLVYEYMSRGTLRDHLYKTDNPPLTWKRRLEICIGAAKGLHYLHTGAKHMIIHRDVKSTNILLDEKWVAKVSDFGLSRTGPISASVTHVSTAVKGSFGYMDPEYYRRQQLTEKSDVYSFGVVLFEILCARPALGRNLPKEEVGLANWAQKCCRNGRVEEIIDPNLIGEMVSAVCLKKFVEIGLSCLEDDGGERPSMHDVVGGLEFALELQVNAEETINVCGLETAAISTAFGEGSDDSFSLNFSHTTKLFSSSNGRSSGRERSDDSDQYYT